MSLMKSDIIAIIFFTLVFSYCIYLTTFPYISENACTIINISDNITLSDNGTQPLYDALP